MIELKHTFSFYNRSTRIIIRDKISVRVRYLRHIGANTVKSSYCVTLGYSNQAPYSSIYSHSRLIWPSDFNKSFCSWSLYVYRVEDLEIMRWTQHITTCCNVSLTSQCTHTYWHKCKSSLYARIFCFTEWRIFYAYPRLTNNLYCTVKRLWPYDCLDTTDYGPLIELRGMLLFIK